MHLDLKMIQLTKTELEKPMFSFEILLSDLNIAMNKNQYEAVFKMAEYLRSYEKFIDSK